MGDTSAPPSGNLALGWSLIPDELRLRILQYALTEEDPIDFTRFNDVFENRLVPVASCSDLSGLAKEAFYTINTFVISASEFGSCHHPNPTQNRYVRYLRIYVEKSYFSWRFLRRISEGRFGFENLHVLELVINHLFMDDFNTMKQFREDVEEQGDIVFEVRKLVVEYRQNIPITRGDEEYLAEAQKLENLVFQTVTIGEKDGVRRQETIQWDYWSYNATSHEYVPVEDHRLVAGSSGYTSRTQWY